jgi:hypothetical protein
MSKEIFLPSSARTGGVVLPRRVESEVMREQAQMVQELYEITEKLDHFNRELYKIDHYLKVMLAKPQTTVEGLKPGYYHLIRMRPGHLAYIKPVEGPNGEWRDLDSSIFDLVAMDDLWNDRTQRELRQRQRRADEARKRQRDREAMDRAREFDERLKSRDNVSIRVSRNIT